MWKELLTLLGGSAVVVTAVAWLTRSIIIHFLNKNVEAFKSGLELKLIEHEIKYRRVDEEVAKRLDELYQKLFIVYETVNSYVQHTEAGDGPSKEEKLEIAFKANKEYNDFLYPNRIYIPSAIFKRARDIGRDLRKVADEFTIGRRREEHGVGDMDYWLNGVKDIESKVNPLLNEIVEVCQHRLGIKDEQLAAISSCQKKTSANS